MRGSNRRSDDRLADFFAWTGGLSKSDMASGDVVVRAITNFVVLPRDAAEWKPTIIAAAKFCAQAAEHFEQSGYSTQTLRVVTNPFGEYLDTSSAEAAVAGINTLRGILTSEEMPQGIRIRFAIGEAKTAKELKLVSTP